MKAKILDPYGPRGKRTSGAIRRFLSVVGLLPGAAARSAERHDPGKPRERVSVWDARVEAFREVDPDDRHDPLHEPARQLAALRATLSRDDQAPARDRAPDTLQGPDATPARPPDDPPRSPFGGGQRVGLDGTDE